VCLELDFLDEFKCLIAGELGTPQDEFELPFKPEDRRSVSRLGFGQERLLSPADLDDLGESGRTRLTAASSDRTYPLVVLSDGQRSRMFRDDDSPVAGFS
jgi:hypothetical protein